MKNSGFTYCFVAVLLLFTANLYGQNKLIVNTSTSAEEAFELNGVKKIVFTPEKFVVVGEVEGQEYFLSDTKYLSFYIAPTSQPLVDEAQGNVRVFPTVVTDEVTVEADEPILKLLLNDLNGRIVKQEAFMDPIVKLDLSGIPEGYYVLQVITSRASIQQRIIKK